MEAQDIETFFLVCLCFGGGVLLGTSLLHMLPELRENFEQAKILPMGHEHYPLAESMLLIGFFLMYFIEELIHYVCDSKFKSQHVHDDEALKEKCEIQTKRRLAIHRAFTLHFSSCVHCDVELEENYDSKEKQYKRNKNKGDKTMLSACSSQQKLSVDFTNLNESNRGDSIGGTMPEYLKLYSTKNKNIYYPFDKKIDAYVQTSDVENCLGTSHGRNLAFRDLIIVVALSLHAVFEGLAIGLENHSDDIWILFAAVATHKFVISFCVGLELYNANTPTILYAIYMSIFSLMTPIGVGVGIAITSAVTQNTTPYMVTVGVLQGFAAGTLLYVCVFEIIEREKYKQKVPGLVQLLCVILGFSSLMLVEILATHDHGKARIDGTVINLPTSISSG